MKKLLPALILLLLCLTATAYAAVPGQQSISYVTDASGYVTDLTDDDASTAWMRPGNGSPDLTLHFNRASVGEIWIRNGYAYTQNWYNHYDRPGHLKITVYFAANQVTTSYETFRYQLTDACRPNSVSKDWNNGYQRLLLPKQYRNVSKIEISIESVIAGTGRTGAAISDVIAASGSHATATPKSYATATPKPYIVYITPSPAPYDPEWPEETDPLVEYITPRPSATPLVQLITPTPKPNDYPSLEGEIGYSNQRIPTRSGPGTFYDEPGSFFSAGHEVKVITKVWDATNRLWWYQFEMEYQGEWYRLYTTETRIDVDPTNLPEEPLVTDPLDTTMSVGKHKIHYGPGTNYAQVPGVTMVAGKRLDIYAIQDGWAQVDYYDYAKDTKRRGWVPLDVVYDN